MTVTVPLAAGKQVGDFVVDKSLSPLGGRPRYEVRSSDGQERLCLTAVGLSPVAEDRRERSLARVRRTLSWHKVPQLIVPVDFIFEGDFLYTLSALPSPTLLEEALRAPDFTLARCVQWLRSLSETMSHLHEAHQPRYLGALPMENLRVVPDGTLQVLGFEVTPDLRLDFLHYGEAVGPAHSVKPKSDLWCLGNWFQKCLELAPPGVAREFSATPTLVALIHSLTSPDPKVRPVSAAAFRNRLEDVTPGHVGHAEHFEGRPQVDLGVTVTSPATTIPENRDHVRQGLLVLALVLVVISLVLNILYPIP